MKEKNRHSRLLAEDMIDTVRDAMLILDESMHVLSANRSFYEKFRVNRDETEGRLIFDLGNGQWNIPELRHLLDDIIPHQSAFNDFKVEHYFESIGNKVMLLNSRRIMREKDEPALILLAIEDITDSDSAQKKLEQSEAKYRKFVEELNSIIIGFNPAGEITFFNHFAEKLFGYNRTEVIGKTFIGTIIPCVDSAGKSNTHICADIISHPKKYYVNESEGIRKDGTRVFFSWSAKANFDEAGKIIEIMIDGTDLTEVASVRKKIESESSVLKTILEFIPVGLMITDQNHVIQNASKSLNEILNIPVEKILYTSEKQREKIFNLYFPNGNKVKPEELPLSRSVITGEKFLNYETELRIDGKSKTLITNSSAIRDNKGKVIGAIGIWQDLTQQKENEQILRYHEKILRESEEKFRVIFEQAAVGIGRVNLIDARWIDVNTAFCKMLGYTADEFKKTPWPQITHPDDVNLDLVPFKRMAAGELDNYSVEKRFIHKKGHHIWARLTLSLVRDDTGHPDYEIAIIEDITERKSAEAALSESEARFRQLADSLPQVVWVLGADGETKYINERYFEYTGVEARETSGGMWAKLIHPDDLQRTLNIWNHSVQTGEPYMVEYRLRSKNSGYRWFLTRALPVRDNKGTILQWFGTATDIHEQKQLMEDLRESEERFRTLADNIAQFAWMADEKGQLFWYNKRWYEYTGLSEEDMKGEGWKKVHHPDYLQKVTESFSRAIAEEKPWEYTFPMRNAAGEYKWFLTRAMPIYNEQQKIIRWFGTNTDITEIRNLQQQLENERELLQTIIDSIPVMITLYDSQIRNIQFNKAFEKITGWTEQEIQEKSLIELVFPDPDQKKIVSEYMQSLTPGFRDMVMRSKSGNQIETSWANVRIPDGRQVGIGIDIRERKHYEESLRNRTEELAAANRDLQSFSYSVAHDLRNPLKIIKGFIEILLEDCSNKLSEECREYVNRIREGADKMNSIIDDILALSKISRQEMETEDINLSELAWITVADIRKNQPGRSVEVVIMDGMKVHADMRLMSLVLNNIFGNAWKYTSKIEHPKIEFGMIQQDHECVFYIKDNGAGFDIKEADKLFIPFKRLHSDKDFSGTGVGLAIVERAISRHGGKIWAEGEVGKGATFYFTLGT